MVDPIHSGKSEWTQPASNLQARLEIPKILKNADLSRVSSAHLRENAEKVPRNAPRALRHAAELIKEDNLPVVRLSDHSPLSKEVALRVVAAVLRSFRSQV